MKNTLLLFSILIISACSSYKTSTSTQEFKPKATKNENGNLIGYAVKDDFKQEPYGSEWFNDYYEYYETDASVINKIKPALKNIKIIGFMGTWCGDSKREIPNFYKILDQAEFDYSNLDLITVNRQKEAKGLEKGYNIIKVPTFIFFKNGKEIGRFVEHTVNGATLENDILQIISERGYKHAYEK
jgi:thiol-disulfide isomerase/thioredoxin